MKKISYISAPIIEVCISPEDILNAIGFQNLDHNELIETYVNDQGRVTLKIKCKGESLREREGLYLRSGTNRSKI